MSRRLVVAGASAALLLAGCSNAPDPDAGATPTAPPAAPSESPTPTEPVASATADPSSSATASAHPTTAAPAFRVGAAQRTIARLARDIGPREATSPSFERAARFVERRLVDLGYTVRDQSFTVPAGTSWGVPVPSGQTRNVVAVAPGTDRDQPHLVVGAHLDTVPQAPGAVDDASGIAIVLEIARMARLQPPPYPVVFVAFAAEEPRGPGDDLHHFGSQEYVRQLTPAQRRGLIGAVAIDSVGVSRDVPVCSATETPGAFVRGVRTAVRDAGLQMRSCVNRTSDHWSFVRNGLAGVRVGLAGTQEYAEYHSARDTVDVVDPVALATAGQAVWAALQRAWDVAPEPR